MTTQTKIEIVNQTFDLMRISGLTVDPTPEDQVTGLTILERMILSYENNGLFLSYNKSDEFPTPDPNEESGLADKSIHAVVMLLFKNVCSAFGKIFPRELREEADTAYRGLFETIPPVRVQNRNQPAGQGQYPYCNGLSNFYYSYKPREERLSVTKDGQLEDLTIDSNLSSNNNGLSQ